MKSMLDSMSDRLCVVCEFVVRDMDSILAHTVYSCDCYSIYAVGYALIVFDIRVMDPEHPKGGGDRSAHQASPVKHGPSYFKHSVFCVMQLRLRQSLSRQQPFTSVARSSDRV